MDSLERLRKINEMNQTLKKHGFATTMDEATIQSRKIFGQPVAFGEPDLEGAATPATSSSIPSFPPLPGQDPSQMMHNTAASTSSIGPAPTHQPQPSSHQPTSSHNVHVQPIQPTHQPQHPTHTQQHSQAFDHKKHEVLRDHFEKFKNGAQNRLINLEKDMTQVIEKLNQMVIAFNNLEEKHSEILQKVSSQQPSSHQTTLTQPQSSNQQANQSSHSTQSSNQTQSQQQNQSTGSNQRGVSDAKATPRYGSHTPDSIDLKEYFYYGNR